MLDGLLVLTKLQRKITKIGKNYGVTFPKDILHEAGLAHGDEMEIEVKQQELIIRKMKKEKRQ